MAQLCSPAHSCCVLLACVLLLCLLPLFFFSVCAALLLSPQQAAPSVSVFDVCGLCVLCFVCVCVVCACVRACVSLFHVFFPSLLSDSTTLFSLI